MRARLLTGATDGIGLALAQRWRARGERACLHGRRPLEALDPQVFERHGYLRADLSDPASPGRMAELLDERGIDELELLVLNAAEGWVGAIEELPPERARALVEVNLIAPLHLCHRLLPRLVRARGRIVFVSSITAQLASPRYAAYAAAKCAAEGFFRSLALELAGRVEVQVLRLGAVRTGLHEKSGLASANLPKSWPSSAAVAAGIDAALAGPPTWRTIGGRNRMLFGVARALPMVVDRLRSPRRSMAQPAAGSPARARRRCAITGAAQGIGLALAERFARAGHELVLIDVDERAGAAARAELARAGAAVEFLRADLALPMEVDRLVGELSRRPPCDVFVHNAGVNAVGRFGELSFEAQRRVLEVNFVAPLVLSAGLLRSGRLAPGGLVVCISSLSRFVSYPGASAYAASKDGLAHLARSLRLALAPTGRRVLTVYPGPTRTEHARRHSPDNSREERRMDPARLADEVFRSAQGRRRVLVPGRANQLAAAFGHVLPGVARGAMKRAILDKL